MKILIYITMYYYKYPSMQQRYINHTNFVFIRTLFISFMISNINVFNVSYLHDFVDRFLSQFAIMLKRFCDVA